MNVEDGCAYIAVGERSIRVMTDGGGRIYILRPPRDGGPSKTEPTLVPLSFDYLTGELVGRDVDKSAAPTPGAVVANGARARGHGSPGGRSACSGRALAHTAASMCALTYTGLFA
jgi:hypothetical protein